MVYQVTQIGDKQRSRSGPHTLLQIGIALVCLGVLTTLILISPPQPCFDEPFHLNLAMKVRELGWREALTSPENQSQAGPLFPAIHLALEPLTQLRAPAVRWANLICLFAVMSVLMPQISGADSTRAWLSAVSILSVPFVWPVTGMALTELPALMFFTFFIFTFQKMMELPDTFSAEAIGWAGLAGVCAGVAVLGRQTYLVVFPVVVVMAGWLPRKWPLLLICIVIGFLVCGPLFFLWHGLLPPSFADKDSGLRLGNGVLSVSYAAGATLFLNPLWMKPERKVLFGCLVGGVTLACFVRDFSQPPAQSLLLHLFPETIALLVGFLIGSCLIVFGLIWLCRVAVEAWNARRTPTRIFLVLVLMALVAAPMKVTHQFSSRYVVGSLGVLFLVVGSPSKLNCWWAVRLIGGSSLGAAILWTYFHN